MFAKRLKQERINKNITQKELGKLIGVTDAAVGMWENGKRVPDAQILDQLADLFNCTVDYILGRSETRRPYEFDELDPETVKTLTRANKLSPAAREQFKEAVKWVFELDAKERELERLRKGEGE